MGYGAILGQTPRIEEALADYDKTIKGTYPIATGNSVTAGDVVDVVDVVDVLAPVMKPLGEYTEGDVVQLNEGGVPVDFYVAKHDYEAALNGSGRTLLVRKESWPNDQINWNNNAINTYADSSIDQWFNATYKSKLDTDIQQAISTTKFYYTPGNGNTSVVALERSIFHLSATEFGLSQININVEGEALPIAETLRVSRVNGTPTSQWTRSSNTSTSNSAAYISSDGTISGSTRCDNSAYPRPAFTLPATFEFYVGHAPSEEKEITRNVVAVANVENVFATSNIAGTSICRLNDSVSVVAYAQNAQLTVGVLDNQTGTVTVTQNIVSDADKYVGVARLSDTKIVLSWSFNNQIYTRLATIVGNSISVKSIVQPTGNNSRYPCVMALDTDRFAIFYSSFGADGIDVNVGTVSGDTITYPSAGYSKSGCTPINISATLLPDDSSGNKRACVCFSDTNDNNKGKAVIATINSSNVVTWGSVVTFSDKIESVDVCTDGENSVVFYRDTTTGAGISRMKNLSITGTVITPSTVEYQTGITAFPQIQNMSGKFVVDGANNDLSKGIAYVVTKSDAGFVLSSPFVFNLDGSPPYLSMAAIDNNHVILAYADNGNHGYGTSTILEVSGNQIAGSFTVNSTQAIALQSGEAGQEIEVIFAGTTAADFVTEGQKIPSDGVYGYGPMAGWLNVIPYWAKEAGVRIATGSYVGTGKYGASNSNSLTFPFEPKLVIIRIQPSSYDSDHMAIFIKPVLNSTSMLRSSKSGGQIAGNTIPCTWDKNTLTWYSTESQDAQLNIKNSTYYYLVIG